MSEIKETVTYSAFRSALAGYLKNFLDSADSEGSIAILYHPKGKRRNTEIAGYLISPKDYEKYSRQTFELLSMGDFDSPAEKYQSVYYPQNWKGKVPKKVKIIKTVKEIVNGIESLPAVLLPVNTEHECWVNSHGVIYAWLGQGRKLQLNKDEYKIIDWIQGEE